MKRSETMKRCSKCKKYKLFPEFYKNRSTKDGLAAYCKICSEMSMVKWRKENKEKVKKFITSWKLKNKDKVIQHTVNYKPKRRLWAKEHRELTRNSIKKWRKKNPQKTKAHLSVEMALQKNKILREDCRVCGSSQVHGHHPDYSKPLEVIWLCPLHHSWAHKGRILL